MQVENYISLKTDLQKEDYYRKEVCPMSQDTGLWEPEFTVTEHNEFDYLILSQKKPYQYISQTHILIQCEWQLLLKI